MSPTSHLVRLLMFRPSKYRILIPFPEIPRWKVKLRNQNPAEKGQTPTTAPSLSLSALPPLLALQPSPTRLRLPSSHPTLSPSSNIRKEVWHSHASSSFLVTREPQRVSCA
jgi:hypothetical protein